MDTARSDADARAGACAAYARWFAGLEASDVDAAVSALTSDVVQQNPAGDIRIGRDAVAAALHEFLGTYTERVRWELTLVRTTGEEADVRVGAETVIRARAGGPSVCVRGTHLGRVRREPDGCRRIARDSSIVDGPPEMLPGQSRSRLRRAGVTVRHQG